MTSVPLWQNSSFAFLAALRETSFVRTVLTTDPAEAADFIKRGGIVAFPTETVYGLGAIVFDAEAVGKIFEAKRRPADNPLIAHVADVGQIGDLATEITERAERFIHSFFPGPLTIVLPKAAKVPIMATAGLDTIGVRMPRNELAREFLQACGMPLVAPSANISGRPSPTTWEAVYEDLNGRIDCILQGEATEIGLESTVVDCTSRIPLVLRLGAISLAELQFVVPETSIYETSETEAPRSPGVRHKHYSPRARVLILDDGRRVPPRRQKTPPPLLRKEGSLRAYIGLSKPDARFEMERICGSVDEYAHSVFEFFRECDRNGIETIVCESVAESGIGAALMDRLRRAAER